MVHLIGTAARVALILRATIAQRCAGGACHDPSGDLDHDPDPGPAAGPDAAAHALQVLGQFLGFTAHARVSLAVSLCAALKRRVSKPPARTQQPMF